MCLGVPGRIVEVEDVARQVAVVEMEGVRRQVSLGLLAGDDGSLPPRGTWVLVHLGFAMAAIDEHEAAATLEALHSLDTG